MKRSNKKRLQKAASAALLVALAASAMSTAFATEASAAKYEVIETEWGFNKVEQDGGKTLSYSPTSGVTLLEDDGYAFKDLNQNGTLDTYEDWRLTTEERATALADMMVADGRE